MGIDTTRGFVAFPRGLIDWEWYTEPNTARLFFHLLLTANWQEKQWQGITIHPGELVTSQSQLAKQLNLSIRNVRTALEHLQATGYVTVRTGTKYSVVSISMSKEDITYRLRGDTESKSNVKTQAYSNGQVPGYRINRNLSGPSASNSIAHPPGFRPHRRPAHRRGQPTPEPVQESAGRRASPKRRRSLPR